MKQLDKNDVEAIHVSNLQSRLTVLTNAVREMCIHLVSHNTQGFVRFMPIKTESLLV